MPASTPTPSAPPLFAEQIDSATDKARAAGSAIRGLNTAVTPVVFTGSLDEATRRAEKLDALISKIKASPIQVASLGDLAGMGGVGGALGAAGEGDAGGGGGDGSGGGSGSGRGPGAVGRGVGRHSGNGSGADADLKDGSVAKFHAGKLFEQKAPQVMARLQRDLGLSRTESAAILGNLGHESAGFKAFAEGGHGPGRGWAQWTDPGRKRRFFAYATENGLDPKSDEANYGFLKWELTHTHKAAIAALKAARTPQAKMEAFERIFEGAGVKAYASRMRYMRQAQAAADKANTIADKDPAPTAKTPAAKAAAVAQASAPPAKLAGARAMGGAVGRGLSYLVGERGPEVFTPGANGQISTNGVLGKLADVGHAVTEGTGEKIAPGPEKVAKARPDVAPSAGARQGGNFHAGNHTWNIYEASNARAVQSQVEDCFHSMIRQFESQQSGLLSD